MRTAASRRFLAFVLALLAGLNASVHATPGTSRATPSRPGAGAPPAVKQFRGADYLSLTSVAKQLGLTLTVVRRGEKVTLSGPSARAEIGADTREITVNGLRVFFGDPTKESGGELFVSRIDVERCLTPLLRPGLGVAPQKPPRVIALDPGHGGKDTGTSKNEKIFALDVAQRARRLLEAAGYKVVLTREQDVFVELQQRPAIANARGADLFVSIHFNALERDTKTSGFEIFTFAPQHQRSANAWSPTRRDDTESFASPVNRYDHWSTVLSQALHRRFVGDLKVFDRGKKLAHWGVLRGLNCPGVLIECGFLTSDTEAPKIATPEYRQKLAEALVAGVRDYAATVKALQSKG